MRKVVPSPILEIGENIAAGLLDDAIDGGKPEARALADFLGGEERLENPVDDAGRDALAIVAHLDQHVLGGCQQLLAEGRALLARDVARADDELSALRHRIAGVDRQIDDRLFELVEVGLHRPEIAPVLDVERHRLADDALEHADGEVRKHVAELQHLRPERLPAREGEQLPHQPGGAVGVLLDLHQVLERRIGRPVVRQEQVGIADDRGQHVVEVVRDARRRAGRPPASSATARTALPARAARWCRSHARSRPRLRLRPPPA